MSDKLTSLYVSIDQPFSSALAAFGLARLADDLLSRHAGDDRRVRICQRGTHYELQLDPSLDLAAPTRLPRDFLMPIATAKNAASLPRVDGVAPFDYDARRAEVGEYFELRKKATPAALRAAADDSPLRQRMDAIAPDGRWYAMATINQMQALISYNEVAALWLACRDCWPDLLAIIRSIWGAFPNDTAKAMAQWQALAKKRGLDAKGEVTASQVVNPEQGKGANRAKADTLTIGNQGAFWLAEAVKFAGLFVGAVPRTVSGVKDRKTYVLLPRELDYATHKHIFDAFQTALWPATAVKMDVLAALRYSKEFVSQYLAVQGGLPGSSYRAEDYVQALAVASYKDLGSAVATINLAALNLPAWGAPLGDAEDARRLDAVLEEHIAIIRNLDEDKSEEQRLLRAYRDFLSSRDPQLHALFAFTDAYAAYVMGKLLRRQWVQQLSTTSLEVIIVSHDADRPPDKSLTRIVRTPGFQNIAEAIRRSTVIPQYQKRDGKGSYEVRYGLGDRLKRKAHYPLQFIQELSEFVHLYNQENARHFERQGTQFRKAVTTEDLAQLAALLDEYGADAPAVAHLLIAYGYARDPKERAAEPGPQPTDEPALATADGLDGDGIDH